MRNKSYVSTAVCAVIFGLGLQGCGGGGGDSQSATPDALTDVELSGSVGDGPLVGAQLTIFSSSGEVLSTGTSDQSAGYTVQLKTKGKYYPLVIDATGGTDIVTNLAPTFPLESAATAPRNKVIANLNPFTTLAISTARQMGGALNSNDIDSALSTVVAEFNSGLDTLAGTGPMSTPIDDANLAEIVKSSETLAEIFRRTNTIVVGARGASTVADVIKALGGDLTDGRFDGQGRGSADAFVSAVAVLVSAQVYIEAMTNTLQEGGQSVMSNLDQAINKLASQPMTAPTASLPVTPDMIRKAKNGVAAALAIAPSAELQGVAAALDSVSAGMLPAEVAAILPGSASAAFGPALTRITSALASDVETVNTTGSTGVPPGGPSPDPNTAPTITGSPPAAAVAGVQYTFTPSASDTDGDALTFSIQNKPAWATFSDTTGTLSGTPASTDVGVFEGIQIGVTDGQASASLAAFSITVSTVNHPPTISGTPPTTVLEGTAYRFQPTASDTDGDALTFSIQNKPAWATFSASTGALAGTPGAGDVGTYANVTITVSDGQMSSSLPAFGIDVSAVATGSVTLTWTAPTQNTDGSPLLDLSGYKIYWGTASGNYQSSVTLNNPGLTTYVVENLTSGTYYFSASAFNSSGVESSLSNEASKAVP
jgi:hypothetical protein